MGKGQPAKTEMQRATFSLFPEVEPSRKGGDAAREERAASNREGVARCTFPFVPL